jgi:hypothetical protein
MNHLLYENLRLWIQRLKPQGILHIWAWEFIEGIKAQACVFYQDRTTNLDDRYNLINPL